MPGSTLPDDDVTYVARAAAQLARGMVVGDHPGSTTRCTCSAGAGSGCPASRSSKLLDRPWARHDRSPIVVHSDRLLLGPGPSNPYPEVMEAFQRPVLGHLDPDFLVVLDEIADRLRLVFRTDNALTLPISGTGSAGMEACFVNLLEPGDTAIVGVNGVFGERMCEVARRCGAVVVRVDAPWGRTIDPQRLLDAQHEHPGARLVAVVHAETSTGVENEIAPLAALQADRHVAVGRHRHVARGHSRSTSTAGGSTRSTRARRNASGCRRDCRPLSFSARAVERVRGRSQPAQSWYLDLASSPTMSARPRRYHHTAPISMLYALHAGLGVVLEEGLDAAHARHRHAGASAPGRAAGARLPALRPRTAAAPAHLGLAARRRRRRQGASRAAGALRDRGRRRAGRASRARAGVSALWVIRLASARSSR